jgi:TPR repeat protein
MIEVDLRKAAHWYEKAATNGHMISQRLLGVLNMDGIVDSKPNMVEAVKWLTEASKQGCSQSQCALGSILQAGNGVQENRDEALRFLSASAAQGCKEAICELGICYYEGDLVMRSLGSAAFHFRLASAQGDVRGSLLLSECYLRGHGVKQDYDNAQDYAKRASLLGPEEEYRDMCNRVRIFFESQDTIQHF